jgi:hypothetical protein
MRTYDTPGNQVLARLPGAFIEFFEGFFRHVGFREYRAWPASPAAWLTREAALA